MSDVGKRQTPLLMVMSAKNVSYEVESEYGEMPPVLIPLGKACLLDKLVELYTPHVTHILVVAGEDNYEVIGKYVEGRIWQNVSICNAHHTGDIGETFRTGFEFARQNRLLTQDGVWITYGDTLIDPEDILDIQPDAVVVSKGEDNKRWATVAYVDTRLTIYEKNTPGNECYDAIVGFFSISDVERYYECVKRATFKNEDIPIYSTETFYAGLVRYSADRPVSLHRIDEDRWVDTGHTDRYARSKGEFLERVFNSLHYDPQKNYVEKRSQHTDKFIDEIRWYLKIPQSLQYYLPRIYEYSLDYRTPYVRMEYYPYNTLSDLWIYARLSSKKWEKIFCKIESVLQEFGRYCFRDTVENCRRAVHAMYHQKTTRRFNEFCQQLHQSNQELLKGINHVLDIDWDLLLNRLLYEVEHQLIHSDTQMTVLHGDLCFSNILFELRNDIIKLIDPRGSFDRYDIYGDPRYDLAKLRHSIVGQYDHVVRGLYHMVDVGGHVELEIMKPHVDLSRMYQEIILGDNAVLERQVSLIEALLFLSMLSLHYENQRKQVALLGVFLMRFDTYLKNYTNAGL